MERDHLEDLGLDGRILKCKFKKWEEEAWNGLICGNKPSGSIKFGEFLD